MDLCVGNIATDAPLDRVGCTLVARMASAGLARCLYPAFTPFDGDTLFAISTGRGQLGAAAVSSLGHLASEVLVKAVKRAVAG